MLVVDELVAAAFVRDQDAEMLALPELSGHVALRALPATDKRVAEHTNNTPNRRPAEPSHVSLMLGSGEVLIRR